MNRIAKRIGYHPWWKEANGWRRFKEDSYYYSNGTRIIHIPSSIIVHPNPVINACSISGLEGKAEVTLFDPNGQVWPC
ncbi:MAG: hypothetical protein LBH19_05400 [Dysgonamonadaceae bacterium]|nr:hypothetical protein [Dysgonamonadaceae bacterium]